MLTRRTLFALVSLLFVSTLHAQDLVKLDDVTSGMMLLKTTQPGVYIAAPTVETDVKLRVRGLILRGEVTQRFRNPESTCAEAVYAFPLPETAAIDRLRMVVGVRVIEGEIKKREEAKQVYEQAKSEGKKASLLEQQRPNLFTVSIANVGAGEEVVVTINYQQSVEYRDGAFRLRFPMTAGPRYKAGDTGLVFSGRRAEARPTSLSVDLDAGVSLRRVESTYHKITHATLSGSRTTVTLDDPRSDHDFELVWHPDLGSEPKSALFTESGKETYGLLMLMPPQSPERVVLPKETIFIIDTSGSMGGPSIEEAKRALALALGKLSSRDRFNVIEFNSITRPLFSEARPVTDQALKEATEWVGKLQADGGTEMLGALEAALGKNGEPGYVRQVIFMTDGQVGNESELFAFIREHLGDSRLFTVGIGSAPNSHFMREAARFGCGTFTYIGNTNDVEEKMLALFAKLESPVLTNVAIRFDDPAAEVWPQRIPDLYAGEPVIVAVRFSKPSGRVIASATRGGSEWNDVHTVAATAEEAGIGKLWARMKIDALSDSPEAKPEEIVQIALAHHLVTPLTSLVAVDVTPAGTPVTACETRPVPLNLPAGWGGGEDGGSLPGTATPAPLLLLAGTVLMLMAAVMLSGAKHLSG
jgi:Ca-activated chloride channel family protein